MCTPGSLRSARSKNSYPSIFGMRTSTNASRQRQRFTSFSASSGSDVATDSYPISAMIADSISSCAGSSSRMQGVNDVFAGMSSTDFDEINATIGMTVARSVPVQDPLHHLLVHSPFGTSFIQSNALLH